MSHRAKIGLALPVGTSAERLFAKLTEYAYCNGEEARKVVDQVEPDATNIMVLERRIRILHDNLGTFVKTFITKNPKNLFRNVEQVGTRINILVMEYRVRLREAQVMFILCPELADLPTVDFLERLSEMARIIRDVDLRAEVIHIHPGVLLLPTETLKSKRPVNTSLDQQTVWSMLISADQEELISSIKSRYTPSTAPAPIERPHINLLPPLPKNPPRRRSIPLKQRLVKIKEAKKIPPPAPIPTAEAVVKRVMWTDEDFDATCRYPMRHLVKSDQRVNLEDLTDPKKTDANKYAVRVLVALLIRPDVTGLHEDTARPFVLHRPWLVDPTKDVPSIVTGFMHLGFTGPRLASVLGNYGGLIDLGYLKLAHVLRELKNDRQVRLPTNLNEIAVLPLVFARRLQTLATYPINHDDVRYSQALFAATQRDFWTIVDPHHLPT